MYVFLAVSPLGFLYRYGYTHIINASHRPLAAFVELRRRKKTGSIFYLDQLHQFICCYVVESILSVELCSVAKEIYASYVDYTEWQRCYLYIWPFFGQLISEKLCIETGGVTISNGPIDNNLVQMAL